MKQANHFYSCASTALCLLRQFTVLLLTGSVFSLALLSKSHAFPGEKGGDGWTIELGFGGELEPQFAGSDNRQLEPAPTVSIAYRTGPTLWFTTIVDYGVYHSLSEQWLLGVSAGLEVGRDEDDDPALLGLGQIDDTWELRFDIAYRATDNLTLAGRAMTAGADKDNVYFLAAIVDIPLPSERFELSLNTDLSWGSRKHLQTEFGVSQQQANNTAYPLYQPASGLKSIGAAISGKFWMTSQWFAYSEFSYEKYDKAGADSPFVDNDYDIEAEVGIAYRF